MKVSIKKLLVKVLDRLLNIGKVYTASWTATSSAANGVHLTSSMTLPAGIYLITITTPIMSAPMLISLSTGGPPYYNLSGHQEASQIVKLTSQQSVYAATSSSASVTYSYLDRGGLKAIRIA